MFSSKLVQVGWAIVVGHTKKQFQNHKFIKGQFLKNKHFTNCNVSKCPFGS
jgi:hypothetical protein